MFWRYKFLTKIKLSSQTFAQQSTRDTGLAKCIFICIYLYKTEHSQKFIYWESKVVKRTVHEAIVYKKSAVCGKVKNDSTLLSSSLKGVATENGGV